SPGLTVSGQEQQTSFPLHNPPFTHPHTCKKHIHPATHTDTHTHTHTPTPTRPLTPSSHLLEKSKRFIRRSKWLTTFGFVVQGDPLGSVRGDWTDSGPCDRPAQGEGGGGGGSRHGERETSAFGIVMKLNVAV